MTGAGLPFIVSCSHSLSPELPETRIPVGVASMYFIFILFNRILVTSYVSPPIYLSIYLSFVKTTYSQSFYHNRLRVSHTHIISILSVTYYLLPYSYFTTIGPYLLCSNTVVLSQPTEITLLR